MTSKKTATKNTIAARGVIGALDEHNKRHSGTCITGHNLFPLAAQRSSWYMDDNYDPLFDSEAITPPDEKYIQKHWQEICLIAADEFHKYITWENFEGFRLCDFEEYQKIPGDKLAPICIGIAKGAGTRGRIIKKLGGSVVVINVQLQLKSGDEKPKEEKPKDE